MSDPVPDPTARVSAAQIADWEATYGTKRRQLYRWIGIGREKGKACPLNDPAAMPAWWRECMSHRLPEKVALAAAAAAPPAPAAASGEASPPPAPLPAGMALQDGGMSEGEAVRQARQIVAANFKKLEEAYAGNLADQISLWQTRWEKSVESLRRQERDDREHQKHAGMIMSRATVETQVYATLKMLSAAHRNMERRVVAELRAERPDLDDTLLELIAAKILRVRDQEGDLFRNLDLLQTADDVFALVG